MTFSWREVPDPKIRWSRAAWSKVTVVTSADVERLDNRQPGLFTFKTAIVWTISFPCNWPQLHFPCGPCLSLSEELLTSDSLLDSGLFLGSALVSALLTYLSLFTNMCRPLACFTFYPILIRTTIVLRLSPHAQAWLHCVPCFFPSQCLFIVFHVAPAFILCAPLSWTWHHIPLEPCWEITQGSLLRATMNHPSSSAV